MEEDTTNKQTNKHTTTLIQCLTKEKITEESSLAITKPTLKNVFSVLLKVIELHTETTHINSVKEI